MSTLKALLKDVPVEWKELKKVCIDFIVPMRDRPKTFDGPIPWCRIEDIEDKYFNKSKIGLGVSNDIIRNMNLKVFPTGTVICSCSASIGVYAINTQPLITNQTFIGLVCGSNLYNRYLLYFMETQTANLLKLATTGTIPYISRKKFEDFKVLIPYPNDPEKSLAIQQEIVRVLDGLSEQNKALTTALAQEIDQRKKQYEYYREELFRFEGKEVEWKSITELFDLKNGYTPSKKIESFWKDGTIPWFRMEDIRANGRILDNAIQTINESAVKGGKLFSANSIIIATSATIGEHALITVPYMANQRFTNLNLKSAFKNRFNMMFIYHYCFVLDEWCKKNTTVGNFAGVNMDGFKKFKFPIPSIQEQERIVRFLDQFDEATKNIVAQLEKEIELRNKQYEYYRNLLLSFPQETN